MSEKEHGPEGICHDPEVVFGSPCPGQPAELGLRRAGHSGGPDTPAAAQEVTFEQLSLNPDRFNGESIVVEGFYFHGFEIIVLGEGLVESGHAEGHLVPEGRMMWVEGGMPREIHDALREQHMLGPSERYGGLRITSPKSGGR